MVNFRKTDLKNRRILITGASSGIGAEFARQFAELGANLILCARRGDKLKELSDSLEQKFNVKTELLVADLASVGDQGAVLGLNSVMNYIKSQELDGLINNAGCGSFGYFDEIEFEKEAGLIALNVTATTALAHAIIPQLKIKKFGILISVSSIAAFQPLPLMATYAATKAYNFVHSLALRAELNQFGIQVLTLCPGPTATEFGGVARVPGTMTGGFRDSVESVVAATIKGLERKQAFVIPGYRAFWMSLGSRLLPKVLTTFLVLRALLPAYRKSED